jgi:hypothetical protein
MVRNTFFIIVCLLMLTTALACFAEEQQSYNLKHTSLEEQQIKSDAEALENYWSPLMPSKTWECSVTLGFTGSSDFLLDHKSLIYKYTRDLTYFGDVKIDHETAFSPTLRLAYDIYPWFSLEGVCGVGVSEYNSYITNAFSISESGERLEIDELGEFDKEKRSFLNIHTGVNALFYPPDYGNFGKGHWHPYIIGGIGRDYTTINSNYTDAVSASWTGSGGAGIRFIADDLISIRFDMMYHLSQVNFDVKESFIELDEGTTLIPIYEYINDGVTGQRIVSEYDKQTILSFGWALGFYANF